jgi:hypothetical protein
VLARLVLPVRVLLVLLVLERRVQELQLVQLGRQELQLAHQAQGWLSLLWQRLLALLVV